MFKQVLPPTLKDDEVWVVKVEHLDGPPEIKEFKTELAAHQFYEVRQRQMFEEWHDDEYYSRTP